MKFQTKSPSVRLLAPLEFKFAGSKDVLAGLIDGYASTFGIVDSYGDVVEQGAFDASLARHKAEGTMPAMLWSHDASAPIGKWLGMAEDEKGLRVQGQLNLDALSGQQAAKHIQAGDVGGLSIGYVPTEIERNPDGSLALLEVELLEVSVVAMPANRQARIVSLKQAANLREFEEQLRSLSYSRADARRLAMRAWPKPGEPETEIDWSRVLARRAQHVGDLKQS